jgi:hypothetical protein
MAGLRLSKDVGKNRLGAEPKTRGGFRTAIKAKITAGYRSCRVLCSAAQPPDQQWVSFGAWNDTVPGFDWFYGSLCLLNIFGGVTGVLGYTHDVRLERG